MRDVLLRIYGTGAPARVVFYARGRTWTASDVVEDLEAGRDTCDLLGPLTLQAFRQVTARWEGFAFEPCDDEGGAQIAHASMPWRDGKRGVPGYYALRGCARNAHRDFASFCAHGMWDPNIFPACYDFNQTCGP